LIGLYELVGNSKELSVSKLEKIISENHFNEEDKERLSIWLEELKFWEEYSRIYINLEKAGPYRSLSKVIRKMIDSKEGERWLDIGCGPLRVSELIHEKSGGRVNEIYAVDIVLQPAHEKMSKLKKNGVSLPVKLDHLSITDHLPYPDNFFDGIGANMALSYVPDFMGLTGKEALKGVLTEIYRVLAPNGRLIWSTPKNGVQFGWVFLASIPDMLNLYEYIVNKDITRILQGTSILSHAIQIQKKGKRGLYTFLSKDELEELLSEIGFTNFVWQRTFAQQVWVNRAEKRC